MKLLQFIHYFQLVLDGLHASHIRDFYCIRMGRN